MADEGGFRKNRVCFVSSDEINESCSVKAVYDRFDRY